MRLDMLYEDVNRRGLFNMFGNALKSAHRAAQPTTNDKDEPNTIPKLTRRRALQTGAAAASLAAAAHLVPGSISGMFGASNMSLSADKVSELLYLITSEARDARVPIINGYFNFTGNHVTKEYAAELSKDLIANGLGTASQNGVLMSQTNLHQLFKIAAPANIFEI